MKKVLIFLAGFIFYPIVIVTTGLWVMRNWTDTERTIYFNAWDTLTDVIDSIKDGNFR